MQSPDPDLPLFDDDIQESKLATFLKNALSDPIKFPQSIWQIEHVEQTLRILRSVNAPCHQLPEVKKSKYSNASPSFPQPNSQAHEPKKQFLSTTIAILLDFLKMFGKMEAIHSPLYIPKVRTLLLKETIDLLCEFSGLNAVEHPAAGPDVFDSIISQKSLQILNNALLLKPESADNLAHPVLLKGLVLLSKKENLSIDSIFLVYRLLFLFSSTGTHINQLEDAGGLTGHVQAIQKILNDPKRESLTHVNALSEILKALFNFLRFGNHAKDAFQPLFLTSLLYVFPLHPEWAMSPPHSHAIHVLLFDESFAWCTQENLTFICINILQSCLDTLFSKTPVKPNKDKETSLLPLFQLLTQAARHDPYSLKQILAPPTPKPLLTEHLLKLFTCIEFPRLKQCIEELMPVLFEDNIPEMVEYTGLGPVAGMLVNRNLFTPEVLSKLKPNASESDEDDLAWKKMTPEEREREAEKIFNGLERLSQLGVITPINSETGQPIVSMKKSSKSGT